CLETKQFNPATFRFDGNLLLQNFIIQGDFMSSTVRVSAIVSFLLGSLIACNAGAAPKAVPSPAVDTALASSKGEQTLVVSGGCSRGVHAGCERVKVGISATTG